MIVSVEPVLTAAARSGPSWHRVRAVRQGPVSDAGGGVVRVEIAELSLAGSDVREAGKEIYCDPR